METGYIAVKKERKSITRCGHQVMVSCELQPIRRKGFYRIVHPLFRRAVHALFK